MPNDFTVLEYNIEYKWNIVMAIYLDILKIILDFEDSNVTAVNANYAPFTFLSFFHLPGRGS